MKKILRYNAVIVLLLIIILSLEKSIFPFVGLVLTAIASFYLLVILNITLLLLLWISSIFAKKKKISLKYQKKIYYVFLVLSIIFILYYAIVNFTNLTEVNGMLIE